MFDLGRASVFVLGRVHGVARRDLREALGRAGATLGDRLDRRTSLVVVGSDTVRELLASSRMIDLLERMPDHASLISELEFRRSLGISPPPPPEPRSLLVRDLARLSGLDEDLLFWLALFDVVRPVDQHYSYRDLVSAKEAARLLAAGCDFPDLVEAAVTLGRSGLRLSEARLVLAPDGSIRREIEGVPAYLDGQFALPFDAPPEIIDDVVECAEEAEFLGDLATAERLYDLAMKIDREDPVSPFNLGNVLDAQGRKSEARIFWQKAVARAPAFPEAWFNLAVSAEESGRKDEAVAHYCRALDIAGDYADAAYNLALLLHETGRFEDALPVWEHFINVEPGSADTQIARRKAADCRFRMRGLRLAAI